MTGMLVNVGGAMLSEELASRSAAMLKTLDVRSEAHQNTTFAPFDPNLALQMYEPVVTGLLQSNSKTYASWLEMNRHWTEFLTRRFQEDVTLVHQLAKCTNPGDVFAVYSDFFQRAFADYQREFAEMLKLGQLCVAEASANGQKAKV